MGSRFGAVLLLLLGFSRFARYNARALLSKRWNSQGLGSEKGPARYENPASKFGTYEDDMLASFEAWMLIGGTR